jgi:hypothetical protein
MHLPDTHGGDDYVRKLIGGLAFLGHGQSPASRWSARSSRKPLKNQKINTGDFAGSGTRSRPQDAGFTGCAGFGPGATGSSAGFGAVGVTFAPAACAAAAVVA